jgi:hypothetical protein
MRPVRNVFQKLSRTEQRREGVVAYLWYNCFIFVHVQHCLVIAGGGQHCLSNAAEF